MTMKYKFLIYFLQYLFTGLVVSDVMGAWEETSGRTVNDLMTSYDDKVRKSECWMTLNSPRHFSTMDAIDRRYEKIRNSAQEWIMESEFDKLMMARFIRTRGIAIRELYAHAHDKLEIPSGINLGGFCMIRMADSIMFFHRMKLRSNTIFRINALHNDLNQMVVKMYLSLNDLHLRGAYERCITDPVEPSILIYTPTYGEVEFLLKDVRFLVEGRYRFIENRLRIEMISSDISTNEILMTYPNEAIESDPIRMNKDNLANFMSRLKSDLNKWLKDYLNDELIRTSLEDIPNIQNLTRYDKEKGVALEEYVDYALNEIAARIRKFNVESMEVPVFNIRSVGGMQIHLYEGVLRGLDSMYRRSVVTGLRHRNLRKVDTLVSFSNLKVIYKYEALLPTGVPPLAGVLTLSANELTAHLALVMTDDPEVIDIDVDFLDQMKPESLTVEGPANIMISNFRHLLEHHIASIMSNSLVHGLRMLRTLPSCVPFMLGQNAVTKKGHTATTPMPPDSSEPGSESDSESDNMARKSKKKLKRKKKTALHLTKKTEIKLHIKHSNKTIANKKILKYKNQGKNKKI